MTWPMHDAGSTTPDPGREEPWPEEPGPDADDLPPRGRHAAPDPLPPLEGPMPGGGPSPAETTLPLALKWPAPPARPHRSPAPGPPGSPPGWRRVPRTTGYPPPPAPPAAHLHPDADQAAGSARDPRATQATRQPRRRAQGTARAARADPPL